MSYQIHKKLSWQVNTTEDWTKTFYPSLVTKIQKSVQKFQDNYETTFTSLNESPDYFTNIFFPMYERLIVSRSNYVLDSKEQFQRILDRMHQGHFYTLLSVHDKSNNTFVGGVVFLESEKIATALRVFDRELQIVKAEASIDFWCEVQLYEYAQKKQKKISHGKDSFPNIGRFGLSVFKMKIGGTPHVIDDPIEQIYSEEELISMATEPIFFFTDPNSDGWYTKSHIFLPIIFPNTSLVNELETVLAWKNIPLIIHQV